MKIKPLIVFLALIYFIMIGASENSAFAQKRIDLKQTKKVMLIVKTGGFFANYFLRLDIKKEEGEWICYQKQRYNAFDPKTHQQLNDTVEKRIGPVSGDALEEIAALLNDRDSAINLNDFKIDRNVLIKEIDSLDEKSGRKFFYLDSLEHSQFVQLLHEDTIVKEVAIETLHPRRWDDEDYYALRFINGRDTISAEAFSFLYPYYLPWRIGKQKYYKPQITLLFEKLRNNTGFEERQWITFQKQIDQTIYWDYFSKHHKKTFIFKNEKKN